jgi:hypothetical protein
MNRMPSYVGFPPIADIGVVIHKSLMRLNVVCAFIVCAVVETSGLNARPTLAVHQRRSADPRDLHHCKLTASRPPDNDAHLKQGHRSQARPADLPSPVARKILDHVSVAAKKLFTVKEWIESKQSCADIFSPVAELTGPANLRLYVAPRYFPLGNSVDYFVMYDPSTRAVTRSPPLIFTKWWDATRTTDPLKKYPIVRMESARKGQPPLLIVEERTHNGNVYDAAVYRYFEIGKDMSLAQILAVEARAFLLSDEYTVRNATFLTPNRVRLDVFTHSPRKWGAQGTVLLERSHSGEPFHVASRMPVRGTRGDGLVTYCDSKKSDDDFLRVGCDFYY